MKNKLALIGILGMVAVLLAPGVALAEGTTCGFETIVVPDGRVIDSFIPGATTFFFLFNARAGRSYTTEFQNNMAGDPTFGSFTISVFGPDSCVTALTTRITEGIDPDGSFNMERRSFKSLANQQVRVTIQNTDASGKSYSFSVSETTQFHPGWSTGGGFETFYSIQNTSNATCSVTLTLFNLAGTQVVTTTQSIAAQRLLATNTQTLGVADGLAGTGTLTHDCPPGAVFVDSAIANFGTSPAAIIPAKFGPVRE